jgi:pyruvate kinase
MTTTYPIAVAPAAQVPPGVLARRTKIVATLGPATDAPGVLEAMIDAGLDCARLNCSHGTAEDVRRRAEAVRRAAAAASRAVAVMLDLQGPKVRLGETATRPVAVGDELVFTGLGVGAQDGEVRVELDGFAELVGERSQLVIGDGSPRFAVQSVSAGRVWTRALTAGSLSSRKGIMVTHARPSLPAITAKDVADLDLAVELGVEYVAQSFVRTARDVLELRALLAERGSRAQVVAKIERIEASERIDEILAAADGVMVARGDYGVEAGVDQVPLVQKNVIARAVQAGKVVITATQMLESMLVSAEPTRAEASDVANAVLDGTSAVMLSAESSVGQHPVEAVQWMARIATAAERSPNIASASGPDPGAGPAGPVMRAAVDLAAWTGAALLIVPTSTGASVRACARYRPRIPIIAVAHDPHIASRLVLEWGVIPTTITPPDTVDELIDAAITHSARITGLAPGDTVVLTAGATGEPGTSNVIVVRDVPQLD